MPSFTDITAYFATNRNRKSDGTYGNSFYEGEARLIRDADPAHVAGEDRKHRRKGAAV